MKPLNPKAIHDAITALLLAHPELKEDDILRADMIEGSTPVPEFLSLIVAKIREAETMWDALHARLLELGRRRDRFEGRIDGLRALIFKIMNAADLKSMQLPEATLTIKGGPSKVVIVDEKLIPAIFCRIRKEPDKKLIKAELESGGTVMGCALSNAEPVLSVTT